MSKIQTEQIQSTGGATFTLPPSQGIANQYIKTDGTGNLLFAQPSKEAQTMVPIVAPEGKGIIGSIFSHSDVNQIYSTGEWSSTGPWTTYTHYSGHVDNNAIQWVNMALGDGNGASGTSESMKGNDSEAQKSRRIQFSNGNRLGHARQEFHTDNSSLSSGYGWRIMPIRNTTASPITISLYAYASNYWSGIEGCDIHVYTPNTTRYSTVTSVSATSISTSTTNARANNLTGTYSVPANTTVLVCLSSTDWYYTTYDFKDTNYFYNLTTTFTNSGIICDMRMLSSLAYSRFNLPSAGAFATSLPPLWTVTATNFGDR